MDLLRNRIVHPYGTGFTPGLERALTQRGIIIQKVSIRDLADLPADTLACVVWFYFPLRSPLEAFGIKRALSRQRIPLLAWNRDAPHYLNRAAWRLDLLDRVRLLDIYATHTLIDVRRQFAGLQLYLPNAADTDSYHPGPIPDRLFEQLREPAHYDYDVSFFGAMDGARYKEMRAREDFFRELGFRLEKMGLRFLFRETGGMSPVQQISLIHRSRINLNFGASCEYLAPIASGLPERCYGIPACGGFLLCDKRTHALDDFTPGENWAEFDGLSDCCEKIRYWLDHFDLARDLAERCHRHVLSSHTYANRAEKLHNALLEWHDGRRGLIR